MKKYCEYCHHYQFANDNVIDPRDYVEPENWGYSIPLGENKRGYRMSINSNGEAGTYIEVTQWDSAIKQNSTVTTYHPKYCPNCGRHLIENELKEE